MSLQTYNRDIPDAPNNPSADQPKMQANTNSIDNLIGEDHFSFNNNAGGEHQQVRIVSRVAPTVPATNMPPPLNPADPGGTLYAREVPSIFPNESQIYYRPDANNLSEYQLTRSIQNHYATFADNAAAGNSGWSFLPGGLLIQWGRKSLANSDTVVFPVAFSSPGDVFSVTITSTRGASPGTAPVVATSSVTATQFGYFASGAIVAADRMYWVAIGK